MHILLSKPATQRHARRGVCEMRAPRRLRVAWVGFVAASAMVALAVPDNVLAWSWPAGGEVLKPYSLGPDPYAGGQHRGIDVAAAADEAIRAPATGAVTFVGSVAANGRTVTIVTTDGYAVTL